MTKKQNTTRRGSNPPQNKRPGWMPELPPTKPVRDATKQGGRATRFKDPQAQREARRYEHPIPSREAILEFLGKQGELLEIEILRRHLACMMNVIARRCRSA